MMPKNRQQELPLRRGRYKGPPPVGAALPRLTQKAFKRHGFSEAHILRHWAEIVGPGLAGLTSPERLKRAGGRGENSQSAGGTLVVRVDGPVAIELKHMEPQVIERINSYYGYAAVGRLKLIQGPLPPLPPRRFKRIRALSAVEEQALQKELGDIGPSPLHEALERLGRRVLGSKKSRR